MWLLLCLLSPYFILAACTLVANCQLEFLYEYMAGADWWKKLPGICSFKGPSRSLPSPFLPSFLLPSPPRSGPQIQLEVWGSAVSSPSGVWGRAQSQTHFLAYFELGNASGDNNFGSYFTSHYPSGGPINFLKQGPTGKSPGFPAGQSASAYTLPVVVASWRQWTCTYRTRLVRRQLTPHTPFLHVVVVSWRQRTGWGGTR